MIDEFVIVGEDASLLFTYYNGQDYWGFYLL
jgi:hypothetical protein